MVSRYFKTFFFSSKSGILFFAHVLGSANDDYYVHVYDLNKCEVGTICLSHFNNDIFFIYNVFVENNFRREHLGSIMIQILDEVIRCYDYKNIYGEFEPYELHLKEYDIDSLKVSVKDFYKRNHFEIINYFDFLEDRSKFIGLKNSYFFESFNKYKILIYRNYVPSHYYFSEVGDILIHDNLVERVDEIQEFADRNLHRLSLKVQ